MVDWAGILFLFLRLLSLFYYLKLEADRALSVIEESARTSCSFVANRVLRATTADDSQKRPKNKVISL